MRLAPVLSTRDDDAARRDADAAPPPRLYVPFFDALSARRVHLLGGGDARAAADRWRAAARLDEALFGERGGVLEPALAMVLLRDAAVCRAIVAASRRARLADDDDDDNAVFEWLGAQSASAVQIIDNLALDRATLTVKLVLPRAPIRFAYAALLDVQSYRLLTRPLPL